LAFWAFSFLLAPSFFEVWMLAFMASRSPGACFSNKEEQSLPDINIADGYMLLLMADFARVGSYKRKLEILFSQ